MINASAWIQQQQDYTAPDRQPDVTINGDQIESLHHVKAINSA